MDLSRLELFGWGGWDFPSWTHKPFSTFCRGVVATKSWNLLKDHRSNLGQLARVDRDSSEGLVERQVAPRGKVTSLWVGPSSLPLEYSIGHFPREPPRCWKAFGHAVVNSHTRWCVGF